MPAMTVSELNDFLEMAFPDGELQMEVTRVDDDGVEVVREFQPSQLRPGGTVSGPTLMGLADCAAYVAVVARIGPEPLTVTSNLNIDFLRKPPPAGIRAVAELVKIGRRQALVAIRIYSQHADELVAHSTCTYALPSTPTVPRADLA
jgi:uncharacterized protein (TIGR00369 family)